MDAGSLTGSKFETEIVGIVSMISTDLGRPKCRTYSSFMEQLMKGMIGYGILLMVQKSCVHQLRERCCIPLFTRVATASQMVVWEFFRQLYVHDFRQIG